MLFFILQTKDKFKCMKDGEDMIGLKKDGLRKQEMDIILFCTEWTVKVRQQAIINNQAIGHMMLLM